MQTVDFQNLLEAAADLRSEHGENPEYDRGLVELISDVAPIGTQEKWESTEDFRRRISLRLGVKFDTIYPKTP